MKQHREEFPVGRMAVVLGVSRSGFYAWLKNEQTAFQERQSKFDRTIKDLFLKRKSRYGRRRIAAGLRRAGIPCSENRVARSMLRQNLRARQSRKFIATTDSRHSYGVAPNLLEREFRTDKPNQVWVTDITYLPTKNGWMYLVIFLDLYGRRVVGWNVSRSLKHSAVLVAFHRAVRQRGPVRGLIIHSDRGIQYCCEGFGKEMELYGVSQSMSRKGDCWDNAVAESFFATLKKELPSKTVFANDAEAERYLFEYIEIEYNRSRPHSTIGYMTPSEYEELYWDAVRGTRAEVA
jgi:transposase InsO family protein